MAIAKTLTGASLKLYINGRPFGIATSIEFSVDSGRRQIFGLDQVTPFELAPGASRITGRIECNRLRQDGGLEGRGLATPDKWIMFEKYISIMLVDRLTDSIVLKVDQAAVSDQSWSIVSKDVMKGTFSFMGMGWSNEASES